MPALSFMGETSVGPFWKSILDGIKTSTMREPRVVPIRLGDRLVLYWKQRTPRKYQHRLPIHWIGETVCTSTERVKLIDVIYDRDLAKMEGFGDLAEFWDWFLGEDWRECQSLFVRHERLIQVVPEDEQYDIFVSLVKYAQNTEFDLIKWRYPLDG